MKYCTIIIIETEEKPFKTGKSRKLKKNKT
jgi:hypothetical protein